MNRIEEVAEKADRIPGKVYGSEEIVDEIEGSVAEGGAKIDRFGAAALLDRLAQGAASATIPVKDLVADDLEVRPDTKNSQRRQ